MSKTLVVITEYFPYLKKESFLETEHLYYDRFDKVIFLPCSTNKYENCRINLDENMRVVKKNNEITYDKSKVLYTLIKTIRYFRAMVNKVTIKEILRLLSLRKLNYNTLRELLSFVSVGEYNYKVIKRYLKENKISKDDEIIFYSYWMHFHAYVAIKLKSDFTNSKVVTRCHRFDLYEYRQKNDYIPLRTFILENMDAVYSISKDGKDYICNKYNGFKNIFISRLGTIDHNVKNINKDNNVFNIVSCSWVTPVKRISRMIDGLSKLKGYSIKWTHIGSGSQFEEIKKYAKQKLSEKIEFDFKGELSNDEIYKLYKEENYHLFINVSESEGIPVSIMEAISFGIPVIATDVGGTSEIVIDEFNGFLLDKDFKDEELSKLILRFYNMKEETYKNFRFNCRKYWKENFDANKNYSEFINNISSL